MILQPMPYPSASGPFAPVGALAYYGTGNALNPYRFDQEVYDDGGWHSVASNTQNFVVPAGVELIRATGQHLTSGASTPEAALQKANVGAAGLGTTLSQDNRVALVSAPIAVVPGDTFQMTRATGSTEDLGGGVWMGIEKLDPATRYALVAKSATQALTGGVDTAVTWATEVADVGGWFDAGLSATKLKVPAGSGISRVRLCFGLQSTANVNTQYVAWIKKNGAIVPGGCSLCSTFTGKMNSGTAVIECAEGDEFELFVWSQSAQTIAAVSTVWFSIEEVPDYTRALVKKVATQAHTGNTTSVIAFGSGSEVYDAAGLHDESADNSRLVVPAGFTRARLCFGLVTASTANTSLAWVRKNGGAANTPGLPGFDVAITWQEYLSGVGAWVPVVEGDYFELCFYSFAGHTLPVDDRTYLGIELA